MWSCVDIGKTCSHWLSNKLFEFEFVSESIGAEWKRLDRNTVRFMSVLRADMFDQAGFIKLYSYNPRLKE